MKITGEYLETSKKNPQRHLPYLSMLYNLKGKKFCFIQESRIIAFPTPEDPGESKGSKFSGSVIRIPSSGSQPASLFQPSDIGNLSRLDKAHIESLLSLLNVLSFNYSSCRRCESP